MEEKDDLIKRLAEGGPEVKTEGDSDLESMQEILQKANQWSVPKGKSNSEIWASLEQKVEQQGHTVLRKRILNLRVAIAASVIFIGSLAYYLTQPNLTYIKTNVAETKQFLLPDGSSVNLNSSSNLSYNPDTFEGDRSLELDGEAYFEVKPGNTFSVYSHGVTTTVLGTSFNIYGRGAKVDVACLSGKVKVEDNKKSVILSPGEKVVSLKRSLNVEKKPFEDAKAISWLDGKFYYENENFELVVSEVQRQFGVVIEGPSFENRFYSGYFDKESVEVALRQVFVPMGYSYEIKDNKIFIQ